MTKQKPVEVPPDEIESEGHLAPTEDPPQVFGEALEAANQNCPTQSPPSDTAAAAATDESAGATWHENKKIAALWCNQQNRNAYVYVSGLNWKKLANNHDSCIVALTMLASHARAADRTVRLQEDNNTITDIYVW